MHASFHSRKRAVSDLIALPIWLAPKSRSVVYYCNMEKCGHKSCGRVHQLNQISDSQTCTSARSSTKLARSTEAFHGMTLSSAWASLDSANQRFSNLKLTLMCGALHGGWVQLSTQRQQTVKWAFFFAFDSTEFLKEFNTSSFKTM